MSRTAFAAKVLPKEFRDAASDPDRLYGALVMALQDGFSPEALQAAQRLFEIDPDRDRAATMLGIAFMKNGKLDEAERVLSAQLARAKSGSLMVNLAKVWEVKGSVPVNGNMYEHSLASIGRARSHSVTPFSNCAFRRFNSAS